MNNFFGSIHVPSWKDFHPHQWPKGCWGFILFFGVSFQSKAIYISLLYQECKLLPYINIALVYASKSVSSRVYAAINEETASYSAIQIWLYWREYWWPQFLEEYWQRNIMNETWGEKKSEGGVTMNSEEIRSMAARERKVTSLRKEERILEIQLNAYWIEG